MIRRTVASIFGAVLALLMATGTALAHEYTVKPGDTLSGIAERHDTTWPEVFELNRSIISDPDLIYPGQVFTLDDQTSSKPRPKPSQQVADTARPATGSVTSQYGMRTHPITGVYKLHTGTDYSYGDGQAYAAKSGTVTGVEWNTAYGNLVTISHGDGDGVQTRYAHLASVSVSNGAKVQAGAVVGKIGSTGYSTGAHLHFEVLKNGDFINPSGWL